MLLKIPYNKTHLNLNIDDNLINGVLTSNTEKYLPEFGEEELVRNALNNPINSQRLEDLVKGKNKIVIISSDHTRPVPSHITMPIYLETIRKGNPNADITILIATGMHRPTTKDELISKYGKKIVDNEKIIVHNAYDDGAMSFMGILPSGGELWINRIASEADLLISEGFIEPHFFAGFSGGRKSVLPGIASKKTVLWNHNAKFISSPYSRAGSINENPIHKDMIFAAKKVNLKFILNVVINSEKKIIYAVSGDLEEAHKNGCEFVSSLAMVKAVKSDIVITSNGGYPLDQNMYQTVKGLSAGEACVNEGGVIIIASSCIDGHGGEFFYHLIADFENAEKAYNNICDVSPDKTEFDQWEAQVLSRILTKANVIVVSTDCDSKLFTDMHMMHASNLNDALDKARDIVGNKKITVIPDGISVIVK